jgi:hypothetical protein
MGRQLANKSGRTLATLSQILDLQSNSGSGWCSVDVAGAGCGWSWMWLVLEVAGALFRWIIMGTSTVVLIVSFWFYIAFGQDLRYSTVYVSNITAAGRFVGSLYAFLVIWV